MRIALIYLGRRGGGARLLRDLSHSWNIPENSVTCFVRTGCEFLDDLGSEFIAFSLPKSNWRLLLPWNKFRFSRKISQNIDEGHFHFAVFVMSHPWTPLLLKKFKRSRVKTVAFIHDNRPHKGEKWPTRYHVKREVRLADFPVFFSRFVSRSFPKISHPLLFSLDALPLIPQSKKMQRILIPGRIRKYKGLGKISKHLSSAPETYQIMFAGQGRFKISRFDADRFKLINEWLPSEDFERLIMESTHILLPYIEATQSGIISIAKLYNCHILITNVGGLLEQLQGYEVWSIIPTDPKDFSDALFGRQRIHDTQIPSLPSIFNLFSYLS
jgi:hypothetical protein